MAYRLVLFLSGVPELPNAIGRQHWGAATRHSSFWRTHICRAARFKGAPPHPLEKAAVTIEVWRKRACDPDNLVASIKPILDGLQPERIWTRGSRTYVDAGAGVISNDARENLKGGGATVLQHRCKPGEKPHIIVTVEEV